MGKHIYYIPCLFKILQIVACLIFFYPNLNAKTMFEAKIAQASLLKKVLDSVNSLIEEGTWDCSESGMSLQAMDSSHVSLCSLMLKTDSFEEFRCDRNISMGLNMVTMTLSPSSVPKKVTPSHLSLRIPMGVKSPTMRSSRWTWMGNIWASLRLITRPPSRCPLQNSK